MKIKIEIEYIVLRVVLKQNEMKKFLFSSITIVFSFFYI